MRPVITLTTDFGTRDGYVAAMKGVLLGAVREAAIVDVSHEVAPQDVLGGAFVLAQAAPWFPPGTVHVAVVDPGVGSARGALIVEHAGMRFVGPDNGLLAMAAPVGEGARCHALDMLPADWSISSTFHGRDVFARVAARLAQGGSPSEFSSRMVQPVALPFPRLVRGADDVVGEVIHVDHFGNLVTNLRPEDLPGRSAEARGGDAISVALRVEVEGHAAAHARTYAEVAPGALLAYLGSTGYLEIAIRDGSAERALGVGRGAEVRVARAPR